MSRLGKTLVSVGSLLIVAVVGILIYCYWPAITGTVNNNKYYTQEDVQKAYDDGFSDGNKSETELNAKYEYYKTLVDDYYIQVTTLNEEITKLSSENASYSSQVKNLTTQKNNLQSQVDNLTTVKTNNENTISSLNAQVSKLEEDIELLNATISNNEANIESLNNQITIRNNKIALLEQSEEDKSTEITSLRNEIVGLQNEISVLNISNAGKDTQIAQLSSQVSNLQSTITQLQMTNELNVNTITSLNSQIANLNSQISELTLLSQNSASTINSLNNKISELQKSIAYYESYIANLESNEQVVATFEFDGSVYNIQIVSKGSKLAVATPTSTTYKIFNGWTVNGETIDLNTYTISANTKIVADVTYKFDIKFIVDETTYNSQIITKNACATLPENPTKTGYEFDGWSINGVDIVSDIASKEVTENTTYKAVFTKIHTVKFMYENEVKSTQTVRNGSYASNVAVENTTHKSFNGWKVNGIVVDLSTYKIVSDTVFEADIAYKYDVVFKVDDTNYNSQLVTKNGFATLPTNPTKDGYEFDGWSINGVDIVSNITTKQVTENITYKAVFTKLHTVMFMCNNEVLETQTIRNGNLATVPTNLVFDSYVITGWKVNDSLVNLTTYKIYGDTLIVAEVVYNDFIKTDVFGERIFDGNNTFIFPDGTVYASSSSKTYYLDMPKTEGDNPNVGGGGNASSATSPSGANGTSCNYEFWQPNDDVIYYSHDSMQQNVIKGTALKWSGRLSFSARDLWKMDGRIYLTISSGSYVYNPTTDDFDAITFGGSTVRQGRYIWQYNNNVYYSFGSANYVLDKSTNTWNTMNWNGLTNFYGDEVWTDGDNIYYSFMSKQFALDKATNTWTEKTFTGVDSFNGSNIWVYKGNTYLSDSTGNYLFTKKAGANN